MFILTARIPKKKLITGSAAVLCCCAVAAALLLLTGGHSVAVSAQAEKVRSNDDRLAYFSSLGWQTSPLPIRTEELLVPDKFDDSYTEYLALQSQQGFDLTALCGKRVKCYTYELTNHPGDVPAQISILVYRDRVVGGQIQGSDGSFVLPLVGA